MIPVSPSETTTLVLNSWFLPTAWMTARATVRNYIKGSVKGVDLSGQVLSWDSWISPDLFVSLGPKHPCMRSATAAFAIPTVVLLQNSFGYKVRKNESVPIRKLWRHYHGECQYCKRKISLKESTIDHWFPRKEGGTNHDFNLVLSCRPCNEKKGHTFPYFDVEGKEVKPKPMHKSVFMVPDGITPREEWNQYLHKEIPS